MSALEGGGGGTLSEIYQSARRQLLRTRDGLEKLERLEYTAASGMDSPELSFSIKKDITQIQSLCVEMDRLWRSIAAKSQRDLWKRFFFHSICNCTVSCSSFFGLNFELDGIYLFCFLGFFFFFVEDFLILSELLVLLIYSNVVDVMFSCLSVVAFCFLGVESLFLP